jgi:coenzyme F420-reducing hydrogenase alpha subunit
VCGILAGRHIHPISMTIGGFTKLPKEKDVDAMLDVLEGMRHDVEATVEFVSAFRFPGFERDTEYVALVSDDGEYPLLTGDIGSSDGVRKNKKEYKKVTNEFIVSHSSAKHTKLSRGSYAVGSLARFNLNYEKLHSEAKETAYALGIQPGCINPFLNTVAQMVESVHCLNEAVSIVHDLKENGINRNEEIVVGLNEGSKIHIKAGNGVGAVEAPRGTLFHNYEIDEKGIILNANCIIPTSQNLNNIEKDMEKLVMEILDKSDEEITHSLEMLVRAYDPCISCSTHIVNAKFIH